MFEGGNVLVPTNKIEEWSVTRREVAETGICCRISKLGNENFETRITSHDTWEVEEEEEEEEDDDEEEGVGKGGAPPHPHPLG